MSRFSAAAASVCIVLVVIVASTPCAHADTFPGASGIAKLDDTRLLIVQDVKIGQEGNPLGVLTLLEEGGYHYTELAVDWPLRQANDLESCFALSDRPGEFLVAESGSYNEIWYDPDSELYNGRIFHLRVEAADDGWHAEVLGTIPIPIPLELHEVEGMVAVPEDEVAEYCGLFNSSPMHTGTKSYESDYRIDSRGAQHGQPSYSSSDTASVEAEEEETPDATIENTAVTPSYTPPAQPQPVHDAEVAKGLSSAEMLESSRDEEYVIVLATRGGATAYEQARLHWGRANLEAGTFTYDAKDSLPLFCSQGTPAAWVRGCSDLYLDEAGVIWVSTAQDIGDAGPFRSTVYRFGELRAVLQSSDMFLPAYSMLNVSMPAVIWEIEGVKIEALGPPMIEGSVLSYATDDEGYGGIWRPLGEASGR